MSQIEPDRTARVSTLELFFDLVFVFTITQLTAVLVAGGDAVAIAQVVLMLTVIWWMYDGYAWLTNAIATDHLRHRASPYRRDGRVPRHRARRAGSIRWEGTRFRDRYLAVVVLHAGMYARGTSLSEVRAVLRVVPLNFGAAGLVLVGLGAALFIACEMGFRRTLGIRRSEIRLAAVAAALATIPLGTELAAAAQVGVLAAVVAAALVVEGSWGPRGQTSQA